MEVYPSPALNQPASGARAPSPRRRFAWALAGALLAHGLLALSLWRLQAHPPAANLAHKPAVVEVRIEEIARKAAPSAAGTNTGASAEADASRPGTSLSGEQLGSQASRAEKAEALDRDGARPRSQRKQAAKREAAAIQGELQTAPSLRDEKWLAAEGLLWKKPLQTSPFGVSKSLTDPLGALGPLANGDRPGAQSFDNGFGRGPQGPVREPTREEKLAEEESRVKGRVTGWILDAQAVARANPDGDRDGYWQDVQDVLEKGFAPPPELFASKPGASPAMDALRSAARELASNAESYGKTGAIAGLGKPGPTMNLDQSAALPADRGLRGTDLDSQMMVQTQLMNHGGAGQWTERLIVHLVLTQTEDGKLADVTVAGSSGNPLFDALALGQARKLSSSLLGPPPKDHLRTIWAFEADMTQLPPMPVAGCQLDGLIPRDCYYPLSKALKSHVRLEAVY